MAISTSTFSTQLDGLRPSIKELASGLHLRVNVTATNLFVDHLTCCQKTMLALVIDDVAPPDALAPRKARVVTFFARLLEGLGRAGAAHSFTVLQCLKDGDAGTTRPDPTAADFWEQVGPQIKEGGPGITMLELRQAI